MRLSELKLSSLILFPTERIKTDDGLTLTTFETDGLHDAVAEEYLTMMVDCTSEKEARMILTLLFQAWSDGSLKIDVDEFYSVEE